MLKAKKFHCYLIQTWSGTHRYINITVANYIIRHWQVMVSHDIIWCGRKKCSTKSKSEFSEVETKRRNIMDVYLGGAESKDFKIVHILGIYTVLNLEH